MTRLRLTSFTRRALQGGILAILFLVSTRIPAQNTLEGKLVQVPEKEVNRQSAFVDAERERILGRFASAEKLLQAFLLDNPQHGAAWHSLSKVQAAQQNNGGALESIRKAGKLEPENTWYALYEAELLEQNGQTGEAVAVYESLSKKYPDNTDYLRRLAYLHTLAGQPKEALKTLDKLEKRTGYNPEIAEKRFYVYVGMNEHAKAAAELERLSGAYPNRMEYRYRLAEFYRETGNEKNARRVYDDILRINPADPVALLAVGKSQYAGVYANPDVPLDTKLKELIPQLEKYRLKPDEALAEQLRQAASAVESAHPDDPRTWSFSGDVHYLTDQPVAALEKYRRCLTYPNVPYSVWNNTLQILYDQKADEGVLKMANLAMEAWPNQPESYLLFGLSAIRLGRNAEAVPVLQQARLMTARSSDVQLREQIQQALDTAQKKN
ncbi:MAG: tetratricopeptide repeat protein [Saprospiraceae bacterium]|nr:tetratricopeptide repeat protein [Saprospiraceae bacterium]